MAEQIITQDYLHQIFDYKDKELYWKIKPSKAVNIGDKAGYINKNNYARLALNGKKYLVHRLIYIMHNNFCPKFLDHIDGNPLNNKIENLRPANYEQNNRNAKIRMDNTSGIKGVSWNKEKKKFRAQLRVNNKIKYFGYYKDIDYAKFVLDAMRYKYHGKFAREG